MGPPFPQTRQIPFLWKMYEHMEARLNHCWILLAFLTPIEIPIESPGGILQNPRALHRLKTSNFLPKNPGCLSWLSRLVDFFLAPGFRDFLVEAEAVAFGGQPVLAVLAPVFSMAKSHKVQVVVAGWSMKQQQTWVTWVWKWGSPKKVSSGWEVLPELFISLGKSKKKSDTAKPAENPPAAYEPLAPVWMLGNYRGAGFRGRQKMERPPGESEDQQGIPGLVNVNKKLLKMAIEIVSFPIKKWRFSIAMLNYQAGYVQVDCIIL